MYYKDSEKINQLAAYLKNITKRKNIIVLCIGSDRSIGDCLAPIIGTILTESNFKLPVYGTLHDTVHALNLKQKLFMIKKNHKNPFIIAIDACLGEADDIGIIRIKKESIAPGSGQGIILPDVGNISIIGIVHDAKENTPFNERGIRLSFVRDMAKVIVKILVQLPQGDY